MFSSIPVEIITALMSGLFSASLSLISMKMKSKAEDHRMMMERLGTQRKMVQDARQMQTKEARWTRRVITLSACFAILIWPSFAPIFNIDVVTGWTEMTGGFWPFTSAKAEMQWQTVSGGIVLTPLHTHTLSAIVGFYFGSSVVENARHK